VQGKAASNEGILRDTRAELSLKKDEMEDLKHQLSQGLARVYGQVNALLFAMCCGMHLLACCLLACLPNCLCALTGLPACSRCGQMQSICMTCVISPMLAYVKRMPAAVICSVVLMLLSMLGTFGVLAYLNVHRIVTAQCELALCPDVSSLTVVTILSYTVNTCECSHAS